MQSIDFRPGYKPHVPLVASPAPIVFLPLLPAVQNRFILPLIVGPSECEPIFCPDQECRPMATRRSEPLVEGVQLAGAHAYIDWPSADRQELYTSRIHKFFETITYVVVQ